MRTPASPPGQAGAFDPPPVDINAVGARERPFPWLLLAGLVAIVVLALAALGLWLRTSPPFHTTRQEDPPATALTPGAAASVPRLVLAADARADDAARPSPAAPVPAGLPPVPAPLAAATPVAARPCPDARIVEAGPSRPPGGTVAVDCGGRVVAAPPGARPASAAEVDRYGGPVLLVRQDAEARPEAAKDGAALAPLPPLPALPGRPPGAMASPVTPLLEQLRSQMGMATGTGTPPAPPVAGSTAGPPAPAVGAPNTQGPMGPMLAGTRSDKALAARTLDENLTIARGTQIDCTLTTRVVTEISGFASCLVSHDVFSANGRTLLVERMSEVQGEYAAASAQPGQQNIHILWTRLRKPGGITIDLASPATDGLGGAGLPGQVDNRWFERIGGAYLLSFIKDAVAYKTARDSATGGSAAAGAAFANTVQQSNSLAEKVLGATLNVRPIQYADPGARVAIHVARDLDFSQVYAVRAR